MNALTPSLTLSGKPLSFAALASIGAHSLTLSADAAALKRVERAREVVERRMAAGQPVYGSTTGVGAMKDVAWTPDELETFNMGLVRAHHFGTGAPFPSSVIRTAMAIRVNTALTGRVGCTPELVRAYLALLAADVVPVVRRTGSIKEGEIAVGNRTRARVVKNKIAPPFRDAEFDIMFDRGISYEGDLIDLAALGNIVEKSGAWYTYKGTRLGQGRENAKNFLNENKDLAQEIRTAVLESKGLLNAKRASDQPLTPEEVAVGEEA